MDASGAWLEINGYLAHLDGPRDRRICRARRHSRSLPARACRIPVRLDFFGDTLESIRTFDPETQRTIGTTAHPRSRADERGAAHDRDDQALPPGLCDRVRRARRATTRSTRRSREGRRYPGLEHWLPLFHATARHALRLPATACRSSSTPSPRMRPASGWRRSRTITTPGTTRWASQRGARPTSRCRPTRSISRREEWRRRLDEAAAGATDALCAAGRSRAGPWSIAADAKAAASRPSAPTEDANVFDAVVRHIRERQADGQRVILAGWTEGSRERLGARPRRPRPDPGAGPSAPTPRPWRCRKEDVGLGVWRLEAGFETPATRRHRPSRTFSATVSCAAAPGASAAAGFPDRICRRCRTGDIVVHVDHGIGRFVGLQTIEAAGAPHDCLELHYAGGDKLFLPVENIELLSRYGSEDTEVQLDRLGGARLAGAQGAHEEAHPRDGG